MASLPPTSLPPVTPVLPGAPPPPVIVPAQVVAATMQNQLLRELTLPVSAVTVTQAPATAAPIPQSQPLLPIPNSGAPAQPALPPLLLQLQTPQGVVQLAVPATLSVPPPQPAPSGTAHQPPVTLSAPQWQQLVDQGHVQLQIAPVPAALLQRLTPGTPPLLAQLIILPRDLARLLGSALPVPIVNTAAPSIGLGSAPAVFTATVLPPALADSYKARFASPSSAPAAQPIAPNNNSPLQSAASAVRNWLDAFRPTEGSSPQISQPRIEPSLAATPPAQNNPVEPSRAPTNAPAEPLSPAIAQPGKPVTPVPLQQVTITLIANAAPATTPPAIAGAPVPASATETAARLLGVTPSGEKLVGTDSGQVLLAPAALPLTNGKTAILRLTPLADTAVTLQPERPATLERTQPALHAALEGLAATAPALAVRLAGQLLLQPSAQPGQLAPSLLFLMAAMGINTSVTPVATGGKSPPTLAPALRDALAVIDATHADPAVPVPPLAERLLAELRQLGAGRMVTDDTGQPWRGFTLPTQLGDMQTTVQTPINLYIQQPQLRQQDQSQRDGAQASASAQKQTRFIVDMQLSRLGLTQLEGLSRARQLDLTLRTHTPLPAALQNDLTARYLEIASATGLTGTLLLGVGKWFTPRESAGNPQVDARL